MGLKIVEAPTMRDLNTEPKQKPKLLSIVLTDIINTIKTAMFWTYGIWLNKKSNYTNSTAFLMALSPPAIKPITRSCDTPKVGGHSEASSIPSLPLVPAPK